MGFSLLCSKVVGDGLLMLPPLTRGEGSAESFPRAAIYLRVSTDEQTTDNRERELRATAERAGHEVLAVYRMREPRRPPGGCTPPAL
jgi:hypothetical protein